jgi:hypothetical protein
VTEKEPKNFTTPVAAKTHDPVGKEGSWRWGFLARYNIDGLDGI